MLFRRVLGVFYRPLGDFVDFVAYRHFARKLRTVCDMLLPIHSCTVSGVFVFRCEEFCMNAGFRVCLCVCMSR